MVYKVINVVTKEEEGKPARRIHRMESLINFLCETSRMISIVKIIT